MNAGAFRRYIGTSSLVVVAIIGFASLAAGDTPPSAAGGQTPPPSAKTTPDELSQRILHKETVVKASREELWRLWTTSAGMSEWWVKESEIELRVLGKFELYLIDKGTPGNRGSDGCRVLSYLPYEMLSFEWNFPPKVAALRDAGAKTHVVLHFDDLGDGQVRVRLDQLGWQDGDDWQQGYDYFDRAWGFVMDLLKKHFTPQEPAAKTP